MSNTPKPQANTLDKITTSPLADSGLSLERAIEKFPNIKAEVDALITEAERKARSRTLSDMTVWANMEMAAQLKEIN